MCIIILSCWYWMIWDMYNRSIVYMWVLCNITDIHIILCIDPSHASINQLNLLYSSILTSIHGIHPSIHCIYPSIEWIHDMQLDRRSSLRRSQRTWMASWTSSCRSTRRRCRRRKRRGFNSYSSSRSESSRRPWTMDHVCLHWWTHTDWYCPNKHLIVWTHTDTHMQ